jgi:hypothetical protein
MSSADDDSHPEESQDQGLLRARRALLKVSLYVAPAIVGTLLIPGDARAQATPTCGPATCPPSACQPDPCGPAEQCGPVECKPIECGPSACRPVGG